MIFEKSAYLFDSSLIGVAGNSQIASVVSFVSNKPYIKAYSSDVISKFDMTSYTGSDFMQWLSIDKNKDAFSSFITQLYNDKNNLGMVSFIVECNYLKFIYLLCLKSEVVGKIMTDITKQIDCLYADYSATFSSPLIGEDASASVLAFNERIAHIINGKKAYQCIKHLFQEHGRSVDDQLSIVKVSFGDTGRKFTFLDYSYYIKQLMDFYLKNDIKDIYTTPESGSYLSEAINKISCSGEFSAHIIDRQDDDFGDVTALSRILLMFADYIFSRVVSARNLDELTDDDRYYFAIAWFVFQNDYSNMLFNSSVYSLMQDIFDSMREELTV